MNGNDIYYLGLKGLKSKQQDLIKEAEGIHMANRAKLAKRTASRRRGAPEHGALQLGTTPAAKAPRTPPTNAAPRRECADVASVPPPRSRPAWRAAAGRVGTSLVSVGRRLEHVGRRGDN